MKWQLPAAKNNRQASSFVNRADLTKYDVEVPESHWQVIQDRLADYRRNPEKVAPAHDVLNRLANKTLLS